MNKHVPTDLLVAFVDGELGEQLAVHIAEHIDECPQCANEAAMMEPLAAAFAAVEDPEVPADLVAEVLVAADAPNRGPVTEVVVASTLLAAAAGLFVVVGDPVGTLIEIGVLANGVAAVTPQLTGMFASSSVMVLALSTLMAVAGSAVAVRFALLDRRLP